MKIVYFQPRLQAEKNYRNHSGAEQVWCPWWALLLNGHVERVDEAELIDARLDRQWRGRLERAVTPGTVLAVSVMTGHAIRDAIDASELAKSLGARVFWGGPHPTLFPAEVGAEPFVDHVIMGFGAEAFGRSIADLAAGGDLPVMIDSRGPRSLVPVTRLKEPTATTPFRPDLSLISSWDGYVNADQALGQRSVNMITSEGCLRRCTYCSEPTTSAHSWLTYDVQECAEVARQVIDRADADGLKLHDPNFLHDVARGLAFARHLRRHHNSVRWAATIHPDDLIHIDERHLAELAELGLSRVLVGLESPVQSLGDLAGKRYDVGRIPDIATRLAAQGIAGMFTFIVGWPGADESHYQRTIDAAFAIRAISPEHQAKIHFLEPWPGTPMARLLTKKNLLLPVRTLQEWAEIDYYFAHLPALHAAEWETKIRQANEELSPYVEA